MGPTPLTSSAAEDPRYPGLPASDGSMLNPRSTGLTQAKRALQWTRIPSAQTVALALTSVARSDPACRSGPHSIETDFAASIHFQSPAGAPAKYGYLGPFTTRTVAFGSIPVEAAIRIRQLRDVDNLSVPLQAYQLAATFCASKGPHAGLGQAERSIQNTKVTGSVEIDVTSVVVDGVDLSIGSCTGTEAIDLNLTAPDVYEFDPTLGNDNPWISPAQAGETTVERMMRSRFFPFTYGGLLNATIDIPPFAGCVTESGEDISRLLTAAISGPNNPLQLRAEAVVGNGTPGGCWQTNTCAPLPDVPLPERTPGQ